MEEFKQYERKGLSEMRPYVKGEDLSDIGVSPEYTPETDMGMVARMPDNHKDQWYVCKKQFEANFRPAEEITSEKSLGNTDSNGAKKNVKDIVFWGNGDTFKLISKASSKEEGWMKSTKAMEIPGVGCVVQVTTQQGDNVAEALTFVPGVVIIETKDSNEKIAARRIWLAGTPLS